MGILILIALLIGAYLYFFGSKIAPSQPPEPVRILSSNELEKYKKHYVNRFKEIQNKYLSSSAYNSYKSGYNQQLFRNIDVSLKSLRSDLSYGEAEDDDKAKIKIEKLDFLISRYAEIGHFLGDPQQPQKHNLQFIQSEKKKYTNFFKKLEKYPLTDRQSDAIIINEDNNLVVAGAGTGKTSTIVGRVGYLLKSGLAKPHEILVLAFANKAKEEAYERIQDLFNEDIDVKTFHGLGLHIIAESTGKKPSISNLSQTHALYQFIQREIDKQFDDTEKYQAIKTFFLYHSKSLKEINLHRPLKDVVTSVPRKELLTYNGELVKSFGEKIIADFLFCNQIQYEYEANYAQDTANTKYRQYQPDFYLPNHDIYIEYFGIDRKKNTAPNINRQRYLEGIRWKVKTHQKNGTILVPLYYYNIQDDDIIIRLKEVMQRYGVVMNPIPPYEFKEILNKNNEISAFAKLVSTFTKHFKSNSHSIQSLIKKANKREKCFLDIFSSIYSAYEGELKRRGEIDFEDMINNSTLLVKNREYRSRYKHIIIDEFQDISFDRYQLIKQIQDQNHAIMFCVGDDWQSIYKFSGSEIEIMTHFEEHFGPTKTTSLDKSFRFNDQILGFSSKFITQNPSQIPKVITAQTGASHKCIHVLMTSGTPEGNVRTILKRFGYTPSSVLVLARYNFTLDAIEKDKLADDFPSLEIKYMTVHSSKGLQADYVIVLDLINDTYGFPSLVDDDPILKLVTKTTQEYLHAEERRLFYVATTRCKHECYLISTMDQRSAFIDEVLSDSYAKFVNDLSDDSYLGMCVKCGNGILILKESEHGEFYYCSNFPICDYKAPKCNECESGHHTIITENYVKCNNCENRLRICPDCDSGLVVKRKSQYGEFFGCSNFPNCEFKRPIK